MGNTSNKHKQTQIPDEIKIVLLSESSGCGKTQLIQRAFFNSFTDDRDITIEYSYHTTIEIYGLSNPIKLHILDTAGAQEFQIMMMDQWIATGDGFILVYHAADPPACPQKIYQKIIDIYQKNDDLSADHVPIILVHGRCDLSLEQQQIAPFPEKGMTITDGQKLAKKLNIPFIETSAKSNIHCREAFELITKEILTKKYNIKLRDDKKKLSKVSKRIKINNKQTKDTHLDEKNDLNLFDNDLFNDNDTSNYKQIEREQKKSEWDPFGATVNNDVVFDFGAKNNKVIFPQFYKKEELIINHDAQTVNASLKDNPFNELANDIKQYGAQKVEEKQDKNKNIKENTGNMNKNKDTLNMNDMNGATKQFYNFLIENNLEKYFNKFKENDCCYIGDIEYLMEDDDFLKNEIGIKNKIHRRKLMGECKKLKNEMDAFNDSNLMPSVLLEKLIKNGIVTMNILCKEVQNKLDLKQKLKINNDNQCDLLWNIIKMQMNPEIDNNEVGEEEQEGIHETDYI